MRLRRVARRTVQSVRRATAPLRPLPDFLVIGSMRCGTTTLHGYLRRHPSVTLAIRKEIHYFEWHYHRGESWYRSRFPLLARRSPFRRGGSARVGEVTPNYLFYPDVPSRVAELLPDARFVVVLRNPVDRAYSHYQKSVREGEETLSFEEALEQEASRLEREADGIATSRSWNKHSYQARGRYAEQIRRWFALFPRDRFLFLDSEELFREPATACARVFEFLGVAPLLVTPEHQHAGAYGSMEPETRERLAASFRTHNQDLYELLARDFGW